MTTDHPGLTRDWIARREQLEGVLSAHDALVGTCGDLTAAVAVGQLRVSDLLAEARADARTALPAALAALKAVLETTEGKTEHHGHSPLNGDNCAACLAADIRDAVEVALRGES